MERYRHYAESIMNITNGSIHRAPLEDVLTLAHAPERVYHETLRLILDGDVDRFVEAMGKSEMEYTPFNALMCYGMVDFNRQLNSPVRGRDGTCIKDFTAPIDNDTTVPINTGGNSGAITPDDIAKSVSGRCLDVTGAFQTSIMNTSVPMMLDGLSHGTNGDNGVPDASSIEPAGYDVQFDYTYDIDCSPDANMDGAPYVYGLVRARTAVKLLMAYCLACSDMACNYRMFGCQTSGVRPDFYDGISIIKPWARMETHWGSFHQALRLVDGDTLCTGFGVTVSHAMRMDDTGSPVRNAWVWLSSSDGIGDDDNDTTDGYDCNTVLDERFRLLDTGIVE